MKALHRKLLRDTIGLRGPVFAIALVVAGGVATWIMSFSVIDSLTATQAAFYREGRFAQVFAPLKRAPKALAARIAEIPGVARVEVRTRAAATLEVAGFDEPIGGELVSLPDSGEPLLNNLYLRAGRLPEPRADSEAVVSETFAEAHGLNTDDRLQAIVNGRRKDFTVVGIGLSPEYVYQIQPGSLFPDYKRYGVLWLRETPLAAAQGMEGAFNDVVLGLAPGVREAEVIERLDRLLAPYGGTGAFGRDDQVSHEYLSQEIQQLKSTAAVVPMIFLGVAGFLLAVVIGRIVHQQRDQIAVLKAFGYPDRAIARHYGALVTLMVMAGALPGVGIGIWLGQGMSGIYREFYRFPFLYYRLEPEVALGGVLLALAAGLLGAWRSVRQAVALPPAEAMRPEPPATYRPTLVERLGLQRWFDQPTRMVLRHLERQRLKALFAVTGIAMGGALLMVGSFQEDAIDHMIDVQFALSQREDLTVTFVEPTSRAALHELAALPGVRRVEPFRAVPVRLRVGHRDYRTALQGYAPDADLHRPLTAGLRPIVPSGAGLLLTDHLGEKLGVGPGDTLTVEVLEGARPTRQVRVAGLVTEYIGLSAYMGLDALNDLMREGDRISGAFLAVDPTQRPAVFAALKERPRVLGVTQREVAIRAFYDTMGETLLIFAFINILLAGSIAFGVVYNAARITLAEHARELASLRVLGFTRGEIGYILLGELALLTLAAIPLAFAFGYLFAWLIATGLASDLYRVPLVLEPSSFGLSAAVMVAASVLSGAIVRRKLDRLDLVGVLKTRE